MFTEGVRVLKSENALTGSDSSSGQRFGLLKLACSAQGSREIFHDGEGIRMVVAQGASSGLHAATKEEFGLSIATRFQLECGIVVER